MDRVSPLPILTSDVFHLPFGRCWPASGPSWTLCSARNHLVKVQMAVNSKLFCLRSPFCTLGRLRMRICSQIDGILNFRASCAPQECLAAVPASRSTRCCTILCTELTFTQHLTRRRWTPRHYFLVQIETRPIRLCRLRSLQLSGATASECRPHCTAHWLWGGKSLSQPLPRKEGRKEILLMRATTKVDWHVNV